MTTCRSDELLNAIFKKLAFILEKIDKILLSNFKVLLAKLLNKKVKWNFKPLMFYAFTKVKNKQFIM
jgi:hypothetical protein